MCCAESSGARFATATSSVSKQPFFYKLVKDLEAEMGAAYPELGRRRAHVEKVLRQEEQRFAETLSQRHAAAR